MALGSLYKFETKTSNHEDRQLTYIDDSYNKLRKNIGNDFGKEKELR
jgi:hypothetical protein